MSKESLISIESDKLFYTGDRKIDIQPTLQIQRGITVLCGRNGSGKSTFAQILEKGRNFRTNKIIGANGQYPKIKCIEFNDIHSLPGVSVEYYQQRYEETMNDSIARVKDILGDSCDSQLFNDLCKDFRLIDAKEKKINFLSSGELRKLLIIKTLLEVPDLLILDNPYIGLDHVSREVLNDAIFKLRESGKSVMLLIQDISEAPGFTDNFLYAYNQKITTDKPSEPKFQYTSFDFQESEFKDNSDLICQLKDCTVKYDSITILENLNWEIREGERWSLSGPNGSGKSTLLSLINADNPKGYCNNLYLFGKKRGSGESIWDIKKNIGYVSPEMQLHFHGSGTALEIVANGLNDTVGLYKKPTDKQKELAEKWLRHFNINHLKDSIFKDLSSGERQLVLIARSFIKEPKLLILDEPMHALDQLNKKIVIQTIEDFLNVHKESSLIMVTHNAEELPSSVTHHFRLG